MLQCVTTNYLQNHTLTEILKHSNVLCGKKYVMANFYHEETGRETTLRSQPERGVGSACQEVGIRKDDEYLTFRISLSRERARKNKFFLGKTIGCELINDPKLDKGHYIFHLKWIKRTTDQSLAYHSPSMKSIPSL